MFHIVVFSGMNQRSVSYCCTREDNNMKHYSGSYQRRQQYETLLWFIPEKTTIWNITLYCCLLWYEPEECFILLSSLIRTRVMFHIVVFSGMSQSNVSYCCLLWYEPEQCFILLSSLVRTRVHYSGSYQRRQQYETLLWFISEKTTIWNTPLVHTREDNNMKHYNQSNVSYCCLLWYEPEQCFILLSSLIWTRAMFHIVVFSDINQKHYSDSYQRRQQYETLLWFIPEKTTIWNITLVHTREDNNMKHSSGSYQRRQQYETLLWFISEKTLSSLVWIRVMFHIVVFSGMNQSNVSYCCLLW
jgi:stalled ribosome alternative rescue factor ArfA